MKLLKYITTVVLLISLAGCSVNEENFPVPLDEVLNNNGAYLRILSVESAGFDILDLENAAYIIEAEVFDKQEGDLLESVEFYVSYTSADGQTIAETSEPVKIYSASEFTRGGQNNLPQATIMISIEDVLGPLGLTRDNLLIGDTFRVRWDLNLTDGRTFTAKDASTVITGGAFFSSPYLANVNVVAAIPEDQFVGSYTLTQDMPSSSVAGAFANGWILEGAQTFSVDITVDPDNTLNGRIFTATPLAEFGVAAQSYPFAVALANDPADNTVTLTGSVGTGLTCGIGISYGPGADNRGGFDIADDSEFTLVIRENINSDCGLGAIDIPFSAVAN